LSTGPDYDFVTYRQMVHEITETFSSLSQRIIEIKNKLSTQKSLTNLAACISNVQALEEMKLEQVSPFSQNMCNVNFCMSLFDVEELVSDSVLVRWIVILIWAIIDY